MRSDCPSLPAAPSWCSRRLASTTCRLLPAWTERSAGATSQRYAVLLLGLAQAYPPGDLAKAIAAATRAREILTATGDPARAAVADGLLGELQRRRRGAP